VEDLLQELGRILPRSIERGRGDKSTAAAQ
jgi:hypothetical protein